MTESGSSWQKQNRKAISSFMKDYDWDRVYNIWKRRVSDFATPITPLFHEADLHDPGNPQRYESELAWWPRRELNELRHKCQQHFDNFPGTHGPTHPYAYQGRKGELHTLELLWKYRDAPQQVAAVLMSASIFSRLGSRAGYPEKWPEYVCVEALHDMINERWKSESGYWHHANTSVLPYTSRDYVYQLEDLHGFVCYLAEEHAALLHQFTPVVVRFTQERGPVLSGT